MAGLVCSLSSGRLAGVQLVDDWLQYTIVGTAICASVLYLVRRRFARRKKADACEKCPVAPTPEHMNVQTTLPLKNETDGG